MDRAAVVRRLARLLAVGDPAQKLVVRLCEAGRQLVGARGSSISINSDDPASRMTLAATDEVAARLESLQDVLGEGPCREAYRQNEPIVTNLDDPVGALWPEFTRSALESAGPVTIHCFPMRPVSRPLGVYSLYSDGQLSEADDVVQFLADAIGAAVLRDSTLGEANLVYDSRSVVYQASGMVAVQLRVEPEDALAILRAHAFAHGATVDEIATQIVQRRLGFRDKDTW